MPHWCARRLADMAQNQVMDILVGPTDQESYATGKGFNPLGHGDEFPIVFHYKGQGRVVFSDTSCDRGGDVRVRDIQYDATESGYK